MTKATLPKWTDERTSALEGIIGDQTPVTADAVQAATEALGEGTTTRSVAAKLRKMGYDVESTAKATGKTYTEAEEADLTAFLNANPNAFTYAEIASQVLGGSRSAKQIQGKILSMELYGLVKATEKVDRPKTYTDEEEVTLLGLLRQTPALFIEDIADTMDRPVNSVRGKILSLSRVNEDITIPKQREYASKKEDAFTALGDVSGLTVEEIAKAIEKTPRGVKTLLTHRGFDCADYNGAKRHAKIQEAKDAA